MGLLRRSEKLGGRSILSRKFLGKTKDFESKGERKFYQKMLKHYLAGHEFYTFAGFRVQVNEKQFYI